jgi:hypothetical protein
MANRRVRVSYGRTVQTAPYESLRLDVSIEKDIDGDADLKAEIDKSANGLKLYVKAKIGEIIHEEQSR